MRWLRGAVALAAFGVFAAQAANAKTPAFVRMTGMACNQCHVAWSGTPDLTFTGLKFRLNGYRTPFVAEKIEAGEEGAMNGKRLVLGLQNAWNLHYRSNLFSQSKGGSDPSLPAPAAGPVASQPFSSVGLDYAGAIGEHFGIWTEYYFASGNGANNSNTVNFVSDDEYDVKYVFNPGGNILGLFFDTQDISAPLWAAFGGPGAGTFNNVGVGGTNGHTPFAYFGAEGMFNDRVAFQATVETGEGNLDYKRMNWAGTISFLPMNSDALYTWLSFLFKAGNDQLPAVSSVNLTSGTNNEVVGNAITGVSALHANGAAYTNADMGDGKHYIFDAHGGFTDRGPWSVAYACDVAIDDETYVDASSYHNTGYGCTARFYYDRTFGVTPSLSSRTRHFTDATGVEHKIPQDPSMNVLLVYRPAMNFAWELSIGNSQTTRLDQNWRNGWSWSLQWHFLY
jgi:hypothetical protein